MKQTEIRPDDEQPSLQERIGDNSIERGIPTDLNVKSRSTCLLYTSPSPRD